MPSVMGATAIADFRRPLNLKQEARLKKHIRPHDLEPNPVKKSAKRVMRDVEKDMEISITIDQTGRDIEDGVFEKLTGWPEKEAIMVVAAMERGDAQLQLHIHAILSVMMMSIKAFNTDLTNSIGCDERHPPGGVICVKSVKNKGLHKCIHGEKRTPAQSKSENKQSSSKSDESSSCQMADIDKVHKDLNKDLDILLSYLKAAGRKPTSSRMKGKVGIDKNKPKYTKVEWPTDEYISLVP
ncbi:hypothetical protein R1sor_015405 [Riccia sorocarpa]|uniref:Uncharacterized protein n=1 Tax=Riccia sorocarpa TaxID=122646 RepID=A0ABD3HGC9_9MARC